MKKIILIFVLASLSIFAQESLDYQYDDSGNRIMKSSDGQACDCFCPNSTERNSWLTLSVVTDAGCGPDKCKLTGSFQIPPLYDCYTHYKIDDGTTLSSMQTLPVNISQIEQCIPAGQTVTITIYLYRYEGDPAPCKIEKTSDYCNADCCEFIDIEFTETVSASTDCCWEPEIVTDDGIICDLESLDVEAKYYDENDEEIIPNGLGNLCLPPGQNNITYKLTIDGRECVEKSILLFCHCSCPTEEVYNEWFTLSSAKGEGNCTEDQCFVQPAIDIPQEYNCYNGFTIETYRNGALESISTQPAPIGQLDLSNMGICLEPGHDYKFVLKLFRYTNDPNPCVLEREVTCDYEPGTEPCLPDCFNDEFEVEKNIKIAIAGCPDCYMNISYSSRRACGIWQDIQITGIEVFNTNSSVNCSSCTTDEDIYQQAVAAIIVKNDMGFEPTWLDIINEGADPCSTVWRVSKASCWATWQHTEFSPEHGVQRTITIYKTCNSDCCLRKLKVCRISPTEVDIQNLYTISDYTNCDSVNYLFNPSGQEILLPCEYSCDMLDNFGGVYSKKSIKYVEEEVTFERNYDDLYADINVITNNNTLQVNISNTNANEVQIQISDINGRQMDYSNYPLNTTDNIFSINLRKFNSGTYVYGIVINGIMLKSDAFQIVK